MAMEINFLKRAELASLPSWSLFGHWSRAPHHKKPVEVFWICPTGTRPWGETQDSLERLHLLDELLEKSGCLCLDCCHCHTKSNKRQDMDGRTSKWRGHTDILVCNLMTNWIDLSTLMPSIKKASTDSFSANANSLLSVIKCCTRFIMQLLAVLSALPVFVGVTTSLIKTVRSCIRGLKKSQLSVGWGFGSCV